MSVFPELEPATREYTFGSFALTEEPSPSAGIIRFRHATIPAAYELTLGYEHLTDGEAELIRRHYDTQDGGHISFTLPAIIWKGHTFSGNIVPVGMRWRYTAPPEETHRSAGYVNLSVSLESDGQLDISLGTITSSLTAGGAGGGGAGAAMTITTSLTAGAATGA
jgi:hypothetical protein